MTIYLHSTFCDDIRIEIGNKLSMMGIYQGYMMVPCFPFDLPRLCVGMKAVASEGTEFQTIKFVLMINNDVVAEMPVEKFDKPSLSLSIPGVKDLKRLQYMQAIIQLPPTRFEGPTIIRTRAITENETLCGDGLMIMVAPEAAGA